MLCYMWKRSRAAGLCCAYLPAARLLHSRDVVPYWQVWWDARHADPHPGYTAFLQAALLAFRRQYFSFVLWLLFKGQK